MKVCEAGFPSPLLEKVNDLIRKNGYIVNNVDAVIIAQEPKVGPHTDDMKKNISRALRIETSGVNVKSTTNERVGSIGRGEAIASYALATLIKNT